MSVEASATDLISVVTLLGAAVVAVPIFKFLGLGSILGYLLAGLIIGPFGLALFTNSQAILHLAELGVVMFLFIIGLEMRPSHLWSLRRDIFGLGSLQILICSFMLTLLGMSFGFSFTLSFIGAMGFVLTSTAVVMQILSERGDLVHPRGQKIVSILLFEDLLIVPLLALVVFMSPQVVAQGDGSRLIGIGIAVASVLGLIAAGVWILNPFFRILALAKAREVLTAAALLVVLGSALLMQVSGLSMAMGAFLAGVLLSESSFRHQIEADIEPFKGILLGLFFIAVGMSLNLDVVFQNWSMIVLAVFAMMLVKAIAIYIVARMTKAVKHDAIDRAVTMAQGGEFAFVLFTAAAAANVITESDNAQLTAIVVLSMALTPLLSALLKRCPESLISSMDGIEKANGLSGSVLIIGFGRFGQVMSQLLLARNVEVTIIDSDVDRIRNASKFGFKIYYGDGSRLDVLQASGANSAMAIAICIDKKEDTSKIVDLVKTAFPQAKILARSYDRIHARQLVLAGVDQQVRETFESALLFGESALREIGVADEEIQAVSADIRRRDRERFELELAEGTSAASGLMHVNLPKPAPLITPQRESEVLSPRTAEVVES